MFRRIGKTYCFRLHSDRIGLSECWNSADQELCYVGQFEGDGKTQLRKVVKEDRVDRLIFGRWDSQMARNESFVQ